MLCLQNTNTNVRSATYSQIKAQNGSKPIDLSWIDRMAVDAYLDALVAIKEQIGIFTAKIAFVSKEDQRVKLLVTIPGIDYFTALTMVS